MRKLAITLAAVVSLAGLAVPAGAATSSVPDMTKGAANALVRKAIVKQLKLSPTHYFRSCKEISRVRYGCRAHFWHASTEYQGRINVWYEERQNAVWWMYSMDLRSHDWKCRATDPGRCSKAIIVGWEKPKSSSSSFS